MTSPASRSDVELAVAAASGRFRTHGGGVRLVDVDDGRAVVGFTGACQGCPCRPQCLESTVVPIVSAAPGVVSVEAVGVRLDEETRQRLRNFLAVS
ncbi:NifU family protein [Micromonospora marina]|uniref:NifU family protein n=1 Tax=Micromonospora marina TaxID=307120 RepID=UPI0034520267